jgi:chromatin assembly factor 1 subunit B
MQRAVEVLDGHTHYVMGCAWDPRGEFVATQSADKTARLYTRAGGAAPPSGPAYSQFMLANVLAKKPGASQQHQPGPTTPEQALMPVSAGPRQPLFHDENMASFFRRLAWAPDGSFLALPAGVTVAPGAAAEHGAAKPAAGKAAAGAAVAPGLGNATWLFKRYCWAQPAACVPSTSGSGGKAIAVRFCPVLFKHTPSPPSADDDAAPVTFDLPYRMVFAVATLDHVGVYDTRQATPLALVSAVHYAALTDLAWSPDGSVLAVASQDGYCTLISFEAGELGEPCAPQDIPADVAARLQSAAVAAAKTRAEEPSVPAAAPQAPPSLLAAMPAPLAPPPVHADVPGASAPPAARRIVPQAVGAAGGAPRRIAPTPVGAPVAMAPAEPVAPVPAVPAPAADGGVKRVEEASAADAPPAKAPRTEEDAVMEDDIAAAVIPHIELPAAEAPPV